MNKGLKRALKRSLLYIVIVFCACGIALAWWNIYDMSRTEVTDEAEAVQLTEDETVTEEPQTDVEPEVLIDFTDIQKQLYEFTTEEFNSELLSNIVNEAAIMSKGPSYIDSSLIEGCMFDITSRAEGGVIYLVIRYERDEPNVFVNVCTRQDRVNPVYSIHFLYDGEQWVRLED